MPILPYTYTCVLQDLAIRSHTWRAGIIILHAAVVRITFLYTFIISHYVRDIVSTENIVHAVIVTVRDEPRSTTACCRSCSDHRDRIGRLPRGFPPMVTKKSPKRTRPRIHNNYCSNRRRLLYSNNYTCNVRARARVCVNNICTHIRRNAVKNHT